MGLILLIVIWLITLVSTYFFIAKTWWLPVGASASAAGIDHHFTTTFILMGVVFVAAQVALGYLVWNYRDRGGITATEVPHLLKWRIHTATPHWKLCGLCSPRSFLWG